MDLRKWAVRAMLVISCAAAVAASTAVGAPPKGVTTAAQLPKYGLHQDLTFDGYAWRRRDAIQAASTVHAQISRNSLLWAKIEPTRGSTDWSILDAVVTDLRAQGIEPLLVLYGSPAWANGVDPSTPDASLYVPPLGPQFDSWLKQYSSFVQQAVKRYKGRVQKWEIWNEENERYFWKPRPDPSLYARFYVKIRQTILSADPTAQVAVGGLAGLCCSIDIPGAAFLDQLVATKVPIDYVAIHPYPGKGQSPDTHLAWENNFDDIAMIHDRLVRAGKSAPLWVTEWGWSTDSVDLTTQAAYVARSLDLLRTKYPYVTVATYFLDYDRGTQFKQGLFDDAFRPKPAAGVFSNFMNLVAPAS